MVRPYHIIRLMSYNVTSHNSPRFVCICLLHDVRTNTKRSILNRFDGFIKYKHGTFIYIVEVSPFAKELITYVQHIIKTIFRVKKQENVLIESWRGDIQTV